MRQTKYEGIIQESSYIQLDCLLFEGQGERQSSITPDQLNLFLLRRDLLWWSAGRSDTEEHRSTEQWMINVIQFAQSDQISIKHLCRIFIWDFKG